MKISVLVLLTFLGSLSAYAQHTMKQIDTCYHWIDADKIQVKIDHARENNGEFLTFNDEVIYCWRSPLGAQSDWEDHGDELIRIKFRPGLRAVNLPRIEEASGMLSAGKELIYSNDNQWHEYTFHPDAIESWSIYQPNTNLELKAELRYYKEGLATPNDVFYSFEDYSQDWVNTTLSGIIDVQVENSKLTPYIFGTNLNRHFTTAYPLPWQKYLNRALFKAPKLPPPPKVVPVIKIIGASYGTNVNIKFKGNATAAAAEFCDGETSCEYKVSPRYLEDPAPDKDKNFIIRWKCGGSPTIKMLTKPAPADDEILNLQC